MAILEKTVYVELSGRNIPYYDKLGYIIPREIDSRKKLSIPRGTKIEVKVKDLPKNAQIKLPKQCDICGEICKNPQIYASIIRCREDGDGKDRCKRCANIKRNEDRYKHVPLEKSVSFKAPHLLNEWNYILNNESPDETFAGSMNKVWWKCPHCRSDYDMSPSNRTNGQNCPYCRGLRVNHTNCLVTTHPELIEEWDFDKNINITPNEVTKGCNNKVWWECSNCKSEWEASPNERTNKSGKNGCPYCAGQKVNHTNCLATTHPELAKEWHPTLNEELTPCNVSKGTTRKVWWIGECGHKWKANINSRTNKKSGCPICNESKGEKRIRVYFKNKNIIFKPQYEFNDLIGIKGGKLKFDFAVFDNKYLKCLIEYDGEFHFEKQFEEDKYETLIIHDQFKNDYCSKYNISLIRIPYWELKNIEEILDQELTKLKLNIA